MSRYLSNSLPGAAVKPHSPGFYYENPVHDLLTALDSDAVDVDYPFYRPSESRPDSCSRINACASISNYQYRWEVQVAFSACQLAFYYPILHTTFLDYWGEFIPLRFLL